MTQAGFITIVYKYYFYIWVRAILKTMDYVIRGVESARKSRCTQSFIVEFKLEDPESVRRHTD